MKKTFWIIGESDGDYEVYGNLEDLKSVAEDEEVVYKVQEIQKFKVEINNVVLTEIK